jgi:tetratricopeptide (TPR) repeat protein
MYLSGKVILEDGTPPSDPATIQLNCGTRVRSVGYTDTNRGSFSIDINNQMSMAALSDASQGSFDRSAGTSGGSGFGNPMNTQPGMQPAAGDPFGDRSLMGCDLQAALPGFRSDVIHLGNRRSMDNPDVGVITLHRLANVEGLTISATSALAPKDAKKALDKGREQLKKGKWDDAQRSFEKAVELYPKYAAAWFELGRMQEEQKNLVAARGSFNQALTADSKFVSPYLELAVLAANEKKWEDVASNTDRLLSLNPVDFPQAYLFNSLANYYLKNFDAAEKTAREGITHDKVHKYPKMNQVLGVLLAQKQDYAITCNLRVHRRPTSKPSRSNWLRSRRRSPKRRLSSNS